MYKKCSKRTNLDALWHLHAGLVLGVRSKMDLCDLGLFSSILAKQTRIERLCCIQGVVTHALGKSLAMKSGSSESGGPQSNDAMAADVVSILLKRSPPTF